MNLEEENMKLKMALLNMIEQFYEWKITIEEARKYNIKCNPENDYVNCYFHLFESAGEKAWQLLGLKNPIVTVEDLWKLEKELRNKYKNCKV